MLCAAAMALTAAIAPIGNSVMLPAIVTVHADDERIEKTYGDWSYYDDTGMVALLPRLHVLDVKLLIT